MGGFREENSNSFSICSTTLIQSMGKVENSSQQRQVEFVL